MSKQKRTRAEAPSILSGEQRINKLLAAAGLGSRRQVDELITDGRVEIDGKTVTQVGIKVNADTAKISVDGEPLKRHRPVYFAVHKPAGVLCTNSDPEGRPRVIDLVPGNQRLFPVGRLDSSSTGLIILTNDGELAQRLAHPRHSVPKSYFVVVAGQVEMESMKRLQRGIYLAEGMARVDGAKIRRVRKGCTEIEITLSEGKNREIRRVLARLGHKVVILRRMAIGPLRLGTMPEGSYRPLTTDEVARLYNAVEDIKKAKKADKRERDKKRAENQAEYLKATGAEAPETTEASSEQTDAPKRKADKATDRKREKAPKSGKNKPGDWKEEALRMVDSLPPMSANPFRQDDDEEDSDEIDGLGDSAILVRDRGDDEYIPIAKPKRGKVISYDDSEEGDSSDTSGADESLESSFELDGDEDFDGDDFGGGFEDDDSDDSEVPADSPWSQFKKKSGRGQRPAANDGRNSREGRPARMGGRNSRSSDRPASGAAESRPRRKGAGRPPRSGAAGADETVRNSGPRTGAAPRAYGKKRTPRSSSSGGYRGSSSSGGGGGTGYGPSSASSGYKGKRSGGGGRKFGGGGGAGGGKRPGGPGGNRGGGRGKGR